MAIARKNDEDVWTVLPGGAAVHWNAILETPVLDPETGEVVLDDDGEIVTEETEQSVVASYETVAALWTEEQRNEIGVFTVGEADPAPDDKMPIGSPRLTDRDGLPVWEQTLVDYVAPPVHYEPISLKQFSVVLTQDGVITKEEALAWAAERVLPVALSNVVDTVRAFDPDQAFLVEMDLRTSTQFERDHPNTPMIAYMLSTPERQFDSAALDDIWTRGALV